jgi:phenylacetate-CoA ligase
MNVVSTHVPTIASMLCGRHWSREQTLAFRNRRLRRLVAHAYRNVPYYRRLMDRNGIAPGDVRTVDDLKAFPMTAKNDLRAAPLQDILTQGLNPEHMVAVRTSGCSGEPFTIRRTWVEQYTMLLFPLRAKRYAGAHIRDKGAAVVYLRPGRGMGDPIYKRVAKAFGFCRQRYVDCCRQPGEMLQALREFRPDVLAGYASTLALIAEAATEHDRRCIRPRLIFSGSEVLTEAMRRLISDTFGAGVHNHYGAHEVGLIAWECRETGQFHTCDDSVIVEVLKDGRPAAVGEEGEVVVTNLHFCGMPFIRYRLGDIVTMGPETCRCGEPFGALRQVRGRALEHFLLPDGRLIHPYSVVSILNRTAAWCWRFQLVQERPDSITLSAVPSRQPGPAEIAQLHESVKAVLGPEVEFHIALVPEIKPGPGGKFRHSYSLVTRGRQTGTTL